MIARIDEIDHEPIIGRFYLVPVVRAAWPGRMGENWPVLLPRHSDVEIIGFDITHYHYDPRFIRQRQWKFIAARAKFSAGHDTARFVIADDDNSAGPPVWTRLKCQRAMPDRRQYIYPAVSWFQPLEDAYADARLKPNMVCPHKGVCLKSMAVVDGVVVCPAHGLRWRVDTGELMPSGAAR